MTVRGDARAVFSKRIGRYALWVMMAPTWPGLAADRAPVPEALTAPGVGPTNAAGPGDSSPRIGTGSTSLLLIPDTTADRVMAFDPLTGNLVDADFIPADPTHLSTPKCAILNATGDGILVSDQIDDVVQEYDLNGAYVGVFAPAGGPNPAILDNILGIALRPNGNLLVTVDSGTNQDSVAEFDTGGVYLGNFIAAGAGGLDAPFDIYRRAGDWLVTGIDSDDLNRYDLATGAFLSELAAINGFPQQIAEAANGNLLIANFSGTQEGVIELTAAGAPVGIYDPPGLEAYRGAYELPNGNILTTSITGVYEISRAGTLVETKLAGVSAQYIELVQLATVPALLVPGITELPEIDGTLAGGEWDAALSFDISLGASPVTLYLAHRGVELFVAVDDTLDTALDAFDQLGVYFDDEGGAAPDLYDGAFANVACGAPDTGEGNYWLGNFSPDADDQWREWIAGPAVCPTQLGTAGVAFNYSAASGHLVYEAAIALDGGSALVLASGQTIGFYLFSYSTDLTFTGQWPTLAVFNDPATYGRLTLDNLLFADGFESESMEWWTFAQP